MGIIFSYLFYRTSRNAIASIQQQDDNDTVVDLLEEPRYRRFLIREEVFASPNGQLEELEELR